MTQETGRKATIRRYLQLGVLILAGGAIYPLIYLRQNFEVSILESFRITISQLNECYALLGILFVLTYLPSGWLADRVAPRWLMTFSLVLTGLLGFWFSGIPSFESLKVIFIGWGFATGLTFWAALIKGVAVLARRDEQGRFFGLLDGGRGLVDMDEDGPVQNLIDLVEQVERREIEKALRVSKNNKTRAADLLGISRFTLQRKLDKYSMS